MGISKGEWEQFNQKMDEREKNAQIRHDEVLDKFKALPCPAHSESISQYKEDRNRVVGAAKFAGLLTGAGAAFTGIYAVLEKLLTHKAHP